MKPVAFFDRDGVLNVEKNYLYKVEDFSWQQGAVKAIKLLNEKGYYVIVVTNQSGVARGFYEEDDVQKLHQFMQEQLHLSDAKIDAFYYCPHHPDGKIDGYRLLCSCRKPEAGMLLQAMQDFKIDKEKSFLIGDKDSDIKAAQKVGIEGYLYQTGNLYSLVSNIIKK